MKIKLNCINCNNDFETEFKYRSKKFCGRKCFFEYSKEHKTIGRKIDEEIREKRICLICNKEFECKKKQENKMCSNECRKEWNSIEENKSNRIKLSKDTLLINHGVDSMFKKIEYKANRNQIFLDKIGVINPMKDKLIVNKLQKTLNEKQIKNLLPKLNEHNIILLDEYSVNKSGSTSMSYNFKCKKCENIFSSTVLGSGKIPICRKCTPLEKNSKIEEVIKDFLNLKNIKHLDNSRKILNGKEIDIFLSDFNLGIEVDGNYFHSEISGEKDSKYHLSKTKLAHEKNIKLIHIFEDEILYKKDIVLSRLSNQLNLNNIRYFARNCEIRIVSKKESTLFLDNNHIQGNSIDLIRLGLYYNNILISLMTFGKERKALGNIETEDTYELVRFCNLINSNVVGGFSKLLKHFIVTYKPKKIVTYADIRWSGLNELDTVYIKNGFKYIKNTSPNYWYLKVGQYNHRYHRYNFRKDILVKEGFDKNMSEFEIMKLKEFDRIWDCGNMKFEWTRNSICNHELRCII